MIVVDSSALIEIALDGANADRCRRTIAAEPEILISAGTLAETLIVALRRGVRVELQRALEFIRPAVVAVEAAGAEGAADAYARWGKSFHPAGLNFGDCFAYALAKQRGCPLLFVGQDFAKTDIVAA